MIDNIFVFKIQEGLIQNSERESKLSVQNYKCGIDVGDLSLSDAEAAHINKLSQWWNIYYG